MSEIDEKIIMAGGNKRSDGSQRCTGGEDGARSTSTRHTMRYEKLNGQSRRVLFRHYETRRGQTLSASQTVGRYVTRRISHAGDFQGRGSVDAH